ncbi:MAG: hypothetical protein SO010_03975 [Candidatus Limiplasma sp.]|nr:hypothetical protein [Candidatus Limiplasma sp.]
MSEGLMTEREWRRQYVRRVGKRSNCWGAQCWQPRPRWTQSRRCRMLLLAGAWTAALLLPMLVPRGTAREYNLPLAAEAAVPSSRPRSSAIAYALPDGMVCTRQIVTKEQLLRGKLLLLDETHPLPAGAPSPNTLSIARYGNGMAPVNDLTIKSGKETIRALTRLFAALRGSGTDGLWISRGTLTPLEQRERRLSRFRVLAASHSLQEAAERACQETDTPGCGELLQEYTVDVTAPPDAERPLEETPRGRMLMQTAWRYGFVVVSRSRDGARLRYVGEAHAAAMTCLGLDFAEYLDFLHRHRQVLIRPTGAVGYWIVCQPMQGKYTEFSLPESTAQEVSLDNLGYAVAACTLPVTSTPP